MGKFINGMRGFLGSFNRQERMQGTQHNHEKEMAKLQMQEYDKQRTWQSGENDKQRSWQASENDKQREHQKYIADLQFQFAVMQMQHQQTMQTNYLSHLADFGGPRRSGFGDSAGYGGQAGGLNSLTSAALGPMGGYGGQMGGFGSPMGGFGSPMGGFGSPMGGVGSPKGGAGSPTGGVGSPTGGAGSPTGDFGGAVSTWDAIKPVCWGPKPVPGGIPCSSGQGFGGAPMAMDPSGNVVGGVGSPIGGYPKGGPSSTFHLFTPGQGFYGPAIPVHGCEALPNPFGPIEAPAPDAAKPGAEPETGPLYDLSADKGMEKGTAAYNRAADKIDEHSGHVDKLVSDGVLSGEEGDTLKAELTERKTGLMNALEDGDSEAFSNGLKSLNGDLAAHQSHTERYTRVEERGDNILAQIDQMEADGKISAESAEQARADVGKGIEDTRSALTDLDRKHDQDYSDVSEGKVFKAVETFLERVDFGLDKVAAEDAGFDQKEAEAGVENGTSQERIKSEAEHLKW